MRITNRMMTTNMLNNVSRNKKNEAKLGDQYSTQQKIQRPSDDPVVAVRSLKYRTQLSSIKQYLGKNIPDAAAWMNMTEGAMVSAAEDLMVTMISYCTNGSNDTLENMDRDSIIKALNEYKEQFVCLANTDYAGRYIFTGFRTDTPLILDEASLSKLNANQTMYTITENLSFGNILNKSFVSGGAIYEAGTEADAYAGAAATMKSANVLQLSYNKLDKGSWEIDLNGNPYERNGGIQGITLSDSKGMDIVIERDTIYQKVNGSGDLLYIDEDGNETTDEFQADGVTPNEPAIQYKLTTKSLSDTTQGEAYTPEPNEIIFIPETGELVFGSDIYATAQKCPNISVEYTKSEFEKGDILPEHYFECTKSSIVVDAYANTTGVYKDESIYYSEPGDQKIDYEINFSQKLTINTLAKDAFSTSVIAKLDELIRNVNSVFDMDVRIQEVTKLIANETDETELANLKELKAQLETEQTLKKTILRESFANGITVFKDAQQVLNKALASHGSRQLRLELTEDRLETQKTEFTELLDSNDGVDMEDSVINFKQAQVIYEASISCAATIISKTLLDYL